MLGWKKGQMPCLPSSPPGPTCFGWLVWLQPGHGVESTLSWSPEPEIPELPWQPLAASELMRGVNMGTVFYSSKPSHTWHLTQDNKEPSSVVVSTDFRSFTAVSPGKLLPQLPQL